MIQTGVDPMRIVKCEKCRKEIGSKTSDLYLIGGWPFCSKKCVVTNDVRIAWRSSINHLMIDRNKIK